MPYPFNWETADFIPTPVGVGPIPVPWGSGANRRFSDDIVSDYKSSDGWVMVYNLFNTTTFPVPGYFILYNKYRGLLRMYFYLPSATPVPSNYMTYNLSLGGSTPTTSSTLNFAGNDIVDVSKNLQASSQIQPYQIVSTGCWYAAQFEIAYDPNIITTNYSAVNLLWQINSTNVSSITLDGTQSGTIKSVTSTPTSSPIQTGTLVEGGFLATGAAVLDNNPNLFPATIQAAMKGAIQSGLTGVIKNVLSAIFGGNSSNSQEVNLNFNTKISLTGNITSNTQLLANNLYLPATIGNQTAPGYSPGYNTTLGVFNLSTRPKINIHTVDNTREDPRRVVWLGSKTSTYSIDNSSINLLINPALTGIAAVQIIKKEIVLVDPVDPYGNSTYNYMTTSGTSEQVGAYLALSNPTTITYTYGPPAANKLPYFKIPAIRITLSVTPSSGAPASTLVKTFLADLVNM